MKYLYAAGLMLLLAGGHVTIAAETCMLENGMILSFVIKTPTQTIMSDPFLTQQKSSIFDTLCDECDNSLDYKNMTLGVLSEGTGERFFRQIIICNTDDQKAIPFCGFIQNKIFKRNMNWKNGSTEVGQ